VGPLLADPLLASLAAMPRHRAYGSVARVVGHEVEIRGLAVRVGDVVSVSCPTGDRLGEVVALSAEGARALLLGDIAGIGRGDQVRIRPEGLTVNASDELLVRVLDGTGAPLDGRRAPSGTPVRVEAAVPPALERRRITEALPVGVRMIDALCTIARGQRVGIFGGSGVGKSTLPARRPSGPPTLSPRRSWGPARVPPGRGFVRWRSWKTRRPPPWFPHRAIPWPTPTAT